MPWSLVVLLLLPLANSCSTSLDCQLNGACIDSACQCDRGWTGAQCSSLSEGRSWILWPAATAQPLSASWGASITPVDGVYHMYATVVYQQASNGTYMTCFHTQGTQIVHATSTNITGPYTFQEVATHPETNNPHAARLSTGEFLLYHLNDNRETPDLPACTGSAPDAGCTPDRTGSSTPCGRVGEGAIGVAVSSSPNGPWEIKYPLCDLVPQFAVPSNPSVLVLPGDEVLVAFRYSGGHKHGEGEAIAVAKAPSFRGPYTLLNEDLPTVGVGTATNSEDPFIYRNKRGYHILVHQYNGTTYGDPNMIPGGHLYSLDAVNWVASEYPLYTNDVLWAENNSHSRLNYRERPELLQDEDGNPRWLVTGGEWGHKYQFPTKGGPCQSFTMITEVVW